MKDELFEEKACLNAKILKQGFYELKTNNLK
jgi:hypothetical protein